MNVLDKNMNGIGSCMPENHIRSDFNIPHEQSSKAKGGGPVKPGASQAGKHWRQKKLCKQTPYVARI